MQWHDPEAGIEEGTSAASVAAAHRRGAATLVLCYHRILPAIDDDPYHLALSTERFEEQLDALATWGRFIGPEALAVAGEEYDDERPRVLVTFDDGYRDNLEHAFPRLARRGIPAVLFVATGAIDRSAPFWWEQVALAHRHNPHVPLTDPDGWRFLPAALRARRVAALTASLPREALRGVEDLAPDWRTLVSEAHRFGVTLGAHTHSHSSLGRLSTDAIAEEVGASMDAIARWTGRPPTLFAYPHGSHDDLSIAALDVLRQRGVTHAFTTDAIAMPVVPRAGSRAALVAPRIVVGDEGAHDLIARLSGIASDATARDAGPLAGDRRRGPRIAVLSGISAHNVGDDAMLVATVRDLQTLQPGVDLRVLAETPDACRALERELGCAILKSPHDLVQRIIAARHDGADPVDAVRVAARDACLRHAVPEVVAGVALSAEEHRGLAELLDADGVLDCGGANLDGHWIDYFYEKCFDYLVAAHPLVVTGQGVGHMVRTLDRELLGEALGQVAAFTVREAVSLQHVRETGFRGGVSLAGDDTLSLDPAPAAEIDSILASVGLRSGEPYVAFQFRRTLEYDTDEALQRFAALADELAEVLRLPLVGVPMHYAGCDEREHLGALAARMRQPGALRIIAGELQAPQALGVFGRASAACGISYHSAVFSLKSGTPFVGVYKGAHYTQKFEGLSRLYDVPALAQPLDAVADVDVSRTLQARMADASRWRGHLAARHDTLLEAVRRPRRALLEAVTRARSTDGHADRRPAPVGWGSLRRLEPISDDWGFDRGQPLDRYYIDHFVARHRTDIRGHVCELLNTEYTRRFGDDRVTRSDVLDIDPGNTTATIVDDLTAPTRLPRDTFDCFILTQTLSYIHACGPALGHAYAATKPGGIVLVSVPSTIRYHREPEDHWRFTIDSLSRLVREHCPGAVSTVTAHGNVLVAASFLYGLASAELSPFELEHHDPRFPVVITARIQKRSDA